MASIFDLYDLLAVRGHTLFAHPAILDDPEKVLKSPNIIDECSFNERIVNLASDVREFLIQVKYFIIFLKFDFKFKGENAAEGTEIVLTSKQKKRFTKIKYPNTSVLFLLDVIKNVS